MRVTGRVPPPLTWKIFQIIVDCLFPTISTCVLNQSCGYWLLRNALHCTISMSLKLKEKNQIVFSCGSLMEYDSIVVDELVLLVFNIRKDVCGVFLSFLVKYENEKAHNMISLMLNLRFKSF